MYTRLSTIPELWKACARGGMSWRRAGVLLGTGMVHFPLYCAVSVARACDHLLHPAFRKMPVRGPVFVMATPRSGTTFLHHLLALDEQNFTHQRLYQTIFPAIVFDRVVSATSSLEAQLGIPFSHLVRSVNRNMFRHWRGIHSVHLDAEEEDESLFVYALFTPTLYLLMPFIDELPELAHTDEASQGVKQKMSEDYRASVQRHLYSHGLNSDGKARRMLIKNVFLASRLSMTKEAFPEGRFIRLVRDPRKAIPSAMSLFFASWSVHSPDIPKVGAETLALFKMFIKQYRRLHEEAQGPSGGAVLTVHFERLIANPVAELRKIYAFLELPFSHDHERIIEQSVGTPDQFKSRHHYSLEDFGLSDHDVHADLFDIIRELGYDSQDTSSAPVPPAFSHSRA